MISTIKKKKEKEKKSWFLGAFFTFFPSLLFPFVCKSRQRNKRHVDWIASVQKRVKKNVTEGYVFLRVDGYGREGHVAAYEAMWLNLQVNVQYFDWIVLLVLVNTPKKNASFWIFGIKFSILSNILKILSFLKYWNMSTWQYSIDYKIIL